MAGTGGHFLKGLSSGIQSGLNMGHEIQEMQWKKAERQRLADAQEKAAEELTNYQSKLKIFSEDGFSEDEYSQLSTLFKTGGLLFQSQVEATHKAIESGHREESQQNIEWMETYAEEIGDSDPKLWKSLFEETRNKLTPENRHYFDAYDRSKQKKFDKAQAQPQPQAETFKSYTEAAEAYKDANIKYSPSSNVYYPEGTKASTTKQPLEYKQKMEDIRIGVANGTYTAEEGKQMEKRLLGGAASMNTEKTVSYQMVKQVRDDILKKDFWDGEDGAASVLKDVEGANYSTEQINIEKERFNLIKEKENRAKVESTARLIDGMLGTNNTLRGDEEYTLTTKKGKKVTDTKLKLYKMLYKQYKNHVEMLGHFADIEEFRKLTPPEELKKTGIGLDTIVTDVQAKDYENIWQ